MRYNTLPGTDLRISEVGFGFWAAGGLWWGDDVRDDDIAAAVDVALDSGINFFDTAPLYGHGHADELLVRCLRGRDAVIATKVGVRWDGEGAHARSDLTADYIAADIDASLKRLGVDTIDLLQIHWPCELNTPLDETFSALQRAVDAGKVRYLGVCNYNADGLRACADVGQLAVLQTPYSILRREYEHGLSEAVEGLGLGVLAYEPLCRGLLTGKFTARHQFPESDLRARDDRFKGSRFLRGLTIASRLNLLAKRLDTSAAALAVAWVLSRPTVTCALVGAKRPEQVEQNADASRVAADSDAVAAIEAIAGAWRG